LLEWWTLGFWFAGGGSFSLWLAGGSSFYTLENLGFSVFVFFIIVDGLWVPICHRKLRGYTVVATAVAITLVYSKQLDTWSIRKKM
jgi:hypothetical protein